jgi:hypothetical protein
MKKSMGVVLFGLVLGMACATRVGIAETHREDINAQARVLAIAAANLEGAVRGRTAGANQDAAAQAVAKFHAEAEAFAGAAGSWHSTDAVNDSYERLIDAWVRVEKSFPDLKADGLLAESYARVQHEWEKMARVTGYAGKYYQKNLEDK